MSERRYQPESAAARANFPDPANYTIVTCPYCIDARHQDAGLAGCMRHTTRGSISE